MSNFIIFFIVYPNLIHPDTHLFLALISFVKIASGLALLSNALVNDRLSKVLRLGMFVIAMAIIMFPFK